MVMVNGKWRVAEVSIPKPFTVPTVFKTVTKAAWFNYPIKILEEAVGFEPTEPMKARRFSKPLS